MLDIVATCERNAEKLKSRMAVVMKNIDVSNWEWRVEEKWGVVQWVDCWNSAPVEQQMDRERMLLVAGQWCSWIMMETTSRGMPFMDNGGMIWC